MMRSHYYPTINQPYCPINTDEHDYRARRITDYLNLVNTIVQAQVEKLKKSAFEKGAEIVVVCHGSGIGLLVKDKSEHADEVARLIKEGVLFAACENTLRDKSIPKENLLPGVTTVPSGAVEVIPSHSTRPGWAGPGSFTPGATTKPNREK